MNRSPFSLGNRSGQQHETKTMMGKSPLELIPSRTMGTPDRFCGSIVTVDIEH
jgi:hypothetical protein